MQLLVVVSVCLVPAAAAQAAAPGNDLPTTPTPVSVKWLSLNSPQDVLVQASDWGDATTGPEDAEPLPSCTGSPGFRSIWYSVFVPEAAVLRVTVVATDSVRYQAVVSILNPAREEVACGLANDVKQASTANATAYVTPGADGTPATSTYLVRVAEVANNTPLNGLPQLTVRFAGKDVTAPHIMVDYRSSNVQPVVGTTYDANRTSDAASGVDPSTARWEFHDETPDGRPLVRPGSGLRVTYKWRSSGAHEVVFRVSDFAGNESKYVFYTFVKDTIRPDVKFTMIPPAPGARRMSIKVGSSESVFVRLVITQVGKNKPLYRNTVKFWGASDGHPRSIPLRGIVGSGLLMVSGIARDRAGNATAIGQCWADPVSGGGQCSKP